MVLSTIGVVFVSLCLWEFAGASLGKCDNNNNNKLFNCSHADLTDLPPEDHIMSYTETLDLSNNYIHNITLVDYSALNTNLRTLILANNQISIIKRNAFKLLTNLVNLDLSGNLIRGSELVVGMFNDLRKLALLNMERNPIRTIRKDTFHFMELPALSHLDLSHCEINTIEDGAIELPTLKYLDLAWNKLVTFNKDGFRMMVNLHTLDLSHNSFKVFDQVPYLPEIRTWYLDSNAISVVNVSNAIFDLADTLEHLYLRNNDIMTFTPDSLPWDMDNLKGIHLDNNPIHCNCKLKWMTTSLEHKERNYSLTCRYPPSLKGHNLLTVPADALQCRYPVAHILILVGLILVVLLCLAVTMYFILRRRRKRILGKPRLR